MREGAPGAHRPGPGTAGAAAPHWVRACAASAAPAAAAPVAAAAATRWSVLSSLRMASRALHAGGEQCQSASRTFLLLSSLIHPPNPCRGHRRDKSERLLSCSYDSTLRLWIRNITGDWSLQRTFEGHLGRVNGATVLDPDRVVSASEDKTLRLWRRATESGSESPALRCAPPDGIAEERFV